MPCTSAEVNRRFGGTNCAAYCPRLAGFLLRLLFDPEEGGCTFLRNVDGRLSDYKVLHSRG
jgi:hypothetical protein